VVATDDSKWILDGLDAALDAALARTGDDGEVRVRPMSGHTGAEIVGLDIARPLTAAQVELVQAALDRWKVVFFRGQHLDHRTHVEFGRRFGELTLAHPHDGAAPDEFPEIHTVDPRHFARQYGVGDYDLFERYAYTNNWHTDVTAAVNPPAGSVLRAEVVPPYGGDTGFTNLAAAYAALSEPVRDFVDGLRAEHRYGANPSGLVPRDAGYLARVAQTRLAAHHPVVRVHPRTGERVLFVSPVFTDRVLGLSPAESRWVLEHLFAHLGRPDFTVRFHWEPGSVAFWDNRATAHLGPQDLGHLRVERTLHRVTLVGEIPVGPDGRPSELVEGEPFGHPRADAAQPH
jgi:alpha-ketoglutarate-dependent sulfate ester dioxygenase